MSQQIVSDLRTLSTISYDNRRPIAYSVGFFLALLAVSRVKPAVVVIAATAALVLPLRFVIYHGAKFDEAAYHQSAPLLAALRDYRFLLVVGLFASLPVAGVLLGEVFLWERFGPVSRVIGAASILGMTWSESLYERNFYYDHWHLDMRLLLVVLGGLSLLTPLFLPLFLVTYHVIVQQFNRTPMGQLSWGLGYTHVALPLTMLLICSAFAATSLVLDVRPYMVVFLLLCAYGAHYVHSGVEKLRIAGAVYYLTRNNPMFIGLNAYRSGWLDSLSERTVARFGLMTERLKPALNGFVLLVELGAIFVLFSYWSALAVGVLTLVLHLSILAFTGDNFWKWIGVNVSLVVGLALFGSPSMVPFADPELFVLSLVTIAFAGAWMKPKRLGWLDSPYFEHYELTAEYDDGEARPLTTATVSPWHDVVAKGLAGHFGYLGREPRVTRNWGDVHGAEPHRKLMTVYPDVPTDAETADLAERFGEHRHDEAQTAELRAMIEAAFERQSDHWTARLVRFLSPPPEYYHGARLAPGDGGPDREPVRVTLHRVDGMWTGDGFHEIRRTHLFTVPVAGE